MSKERLVAIKPPTRREVRRRGPRLANNGSPAFIKRVEQLIGPRLLKTFDEDGPDLVTSILHGDHSPEYQQIIVRELNLVASQDPKKLKVVWPILKKALDLPKEPQATAVRAFFLTSGLVASIKTSLQKEEGGTIFETRFKEHSLPDRLFETSLFQKDVLPPKEHQDLIPREVQEAIKKFRDTYEEIAKGPAKDRKSILNALTLIHTLSLEVPLESFPIFAYYVKQTGHKGEDWINRIRDEGIETTFKNNEQIMEDLLFTEDFKRIAPVIRAMAYSFIIDSDLPPERAEKVVRYFLQDPEAQQVFWKIFPQNAWRQTHTQKLFLQDEETLEKILDTITIQNNSHNTRERRDFLSKLIGRIATLKSRHPDHPNSHYLSRYVRALNGVEKDDALAILLDILDDKIVGVIYVDGHNNIRSKTPRKAQDLNSFVKETTSALENSQGTLYISKAEFQEEKKEKVRESASSEVEKESIAPTSAIKEKPTLLSENWEKQNTTLWGEVVASEAENAAKVLTYLDQKLEKVPNAITQEDAWNTLVEHTGESNMRLENPWIIIPDLLPTSPLKKTLTDVGVVGLEQSNGRVKIVISLEGKKVILSGRLNQKNELVIDGQNDDFSYSTLHLIFNTLTIMQKRSVYSPQGLKREGLSLLHARIKDFNIKAKKEGLPLVAFDPNINPRDIQKGAISFIDNQPIVLIPS